jgi:hypothetical protein
MRKGKILPDQTNEQKIAQSETNAQIQPKQKGKAKITPTGGKITSRLKSLSDLL